MRGYDFESLGVQQGDAILPGGRLLVVELRVHPAGSARTGASAYSSTPATPGTTTRCFKARIGYGVGARVRTPIGPIRVDLAYGQAVPSWRLHFSVGFTF